MPEKEYDICVVGSGASGSVAARILADSGARVVVLEAGDWFSPAGYRGHLKPWQMKTRGAGRGFGEGAVNERTGHIWAKPEENPFTTAGESTVPYSEVRKVGGKTLLWTGHAFRFSAKDFKVKSLRDGLGDDWPIGYEDLKPYYDIADRLLGVSGSIENIPSMPDGVFLPPVPLRCGERRIAEVAPRVDRRMRVIPTRKAIITKNYDGRAACHYCDNCSYGCETWSKWSGDITVKQALRRKNCEIRNNAWACEIVMNSAGDRAIGVRYFDSKTGKDEVVRAKVIALGAGCIQTTRLLMLSKSSRHPEGLCNASGVLGKNLMSHIRVMVNGYLKNLIGAPFGNDDGTGGHGTIPDFYEDEPNKNFARGYIINVGSGAKGVPGYGPGIPGFGVDLKRAIKERYPAQVNLSTHGEMLPTKDTYVELDSGVKDQFGVPGVKVHLSWCDNDRAMERDMLEKLKALIEAGNGVVTGSRGLFIGGVHWSGTARMGDNPEASVVNRYGQAHQVKNLFLVDSSVFVSIAAENPTMTITAVAAYAAHKLLERSRARQT